MNWGKGLIIGMVCFMGFIITLVTIMMNQKIDLVTDNYYLKELEYDKTYDAQSNYENSGEKIIARVDHDSLILEIPEIFREDSIRGYLFCPSDVNSDLNWSFKAQSNVRIPLKQQPKGHYELTLTGKCKGKAFESQHQLTW